MVRAALAQFAAGVAALPEAVRLVAEAVRDLSDRGAVVENRGHRPVLVALTARGVRRKPERRVMVGCVRPVTISPGASAVLELNVLEPFEIELLEVEVSHLVFDPGRR